jgi:hypothetical protein
MERALRTRLRCGLVFDELMSREMIRETGLVKLRNMPEEFYS